jgi:hypothetical protein
MGGVRACACVSFGGAGVPVAGRRAARGANREAMVAVVRDRPGVTAGETAVRNGDCDHGNLSRGEVTAAQGRVLASSSLSPATISGTAGRDCGFIRSVRPEAVVRDRGAVA